MNSPELYVEVIGNSFEQCISYCNCCLYHECSALRLYSACLGSNHPTAANSSVQGPMLMDLEYSGNHCKSQLVSLHYVHRYIFQWQCSVIVGNLLLAQTSLESFPEDLVLLLVKTLSKYIQLIIVYPVRLQQEVKDHCSFSTSTLSNNQSSQTLIHASRTVNLSTYV